LVLVKVTSAAVAEHMLGVSRDRVIDALSRAWVDGRSLRTYRRAPKGRRGRNAFGKRSRSKASQQSARRAI
jgi:2-methylcitrate dehydratase PrpD